jgi:hypothetical protein
MAMSAPNLFRRLHKWAHRQDENFLTESLSLVVESLLALAPAVGTRLVSKLTGGFIDVAPEDASTIEIQTQVEAVAGRPDLEIRVPNQLAWVEVKAESELRTGQLEGYRVLLNQMGVARTHLGLLTRYPELFEPDEELPDSQRRWFEVADWFEEELPAAESTSEVAGFVVRQFLGFLEARSMTLAQVGKFMPDGLRAVSNLMNMLLEAAEACKIPVKKSAGWNYLGVSLDGGKYWVGLQFTNPDRLWFETYSRIDRTAAGSLGLGEVYENKDAYGGYSWCRGVELDSEEVHFYAKSKVRQMEWLEDFLRTCREKALSVETSDQPSLPDEPEADERE